MVEDLMILEEINASNLILDYHCDVYVKGNITGDVIINVSGDFEVDGFVEGCQIDCTGNVLLKRGMNAIDKDGLLTAKGCIVSKFFEYVTIHADKNIYFGTSLNANLSSYGEIIAYGNKGGIIGGASYAEKGFCLPNLGNAAGVETTLLLGTNENIHAQQWMVKKEILQRKAALAQATELHDTAERDLEEACKKADDLEKRFVRACHSKIIVEQQVFDNVRVHYMDKQIDAVPSFHVEILIANDKIIMEKLYAYDEKSA